MIPAAAKHSSQRLPLSSRRFFQRERRYPDRLLPVRHGRCSRLRDEPAPPRNVGQREVELRQGQSVRGWRRALAIGVGRMGARPAREAPQVDAAGMVPQILG